MHQLQSVKDTAKDLGRMLKKGQAHGAAWQGGVEQLSADTEALARTLQEFAELPK